MSDDRPPRLEDPDSIRSFLVEGEESGPGLASRIRNSIERRLLAGDAVAFSVSALFQTVLDYLNLVLSLGGGDRDDGKKEP